MPPTIDCEFGDVVLLPFPIGAPRPTRKRPAVVVSSPLYHAQLGNLLVMAVTTQTEGGTAGGLPVAAWKQAGLLRPSLIAPVLATVESTRVLRKLGRLQPDDRASLERSLPALLGPPPGR